MITISHESMATLEQTRRQAYVTQARPVMRQELPELWARFDDAQIDTILLDQCDHAKPLGIDSARGIYLLFSLRARLGTDFPHGAAHAWAREILSRRGAAESQLLDALEAVLWGEAP